MNRQTVSGMMLTLLLVGMLTLAFNVQIAKAIGTIYIRQDGSIDPPTAPIQRDGDIYTLTDNIYDSIVVAKDNIVIDGAGYTVLGTGAFLYSKGIDLAGRKNVTLRNMSIEGFYYGIYLDFSSNNNIFGNNMTNNEYGIRLDRSSNNSISSNDITANNGGGISLIYSSNNRVSGNNIAANSWDGIYLLYSFDNSISGNDVTNNGDGVILVYSSINSISGNNITANKGFGIPIHVSSSNIIFGNDLVANGYGIFLDDSSSNLIYHNNFLNNTKQVYDLSWDLPIVPSSVTWDYGYPSGGNYWSDYNGTDLYSGPYQNEAGRDGIGDTPYIIDENNQDNYPLVNPWTPTPVVITATVDIDPDTLNLWSRGKWVTAYIELPEGYNISDINITSIILNDTIPVYLLDVPAAQPVPTEIGDYDDDGVPDLMVKFNRSEVNEYILDQNIMYGNVTLTITGELYDGTVFKGSDIIRVRMPGDVNFDGKVNYQDLFLLADTYGSIPQNLHRYMDPDLNSDNRVNHQDLFILAANYGKNYH